MERENCFVDIQRRYVSFVIKCLSLDLVRETEQLKSTRSSHARIEPA